MRKNYKKIIFFILPIALGVFLIWISLSKLTPSDYNSIKESFKNANYFWILLSLLLGLISHLSRAYRWKFMLEPLGYKPRFLNSLFTVFTGNFVNLGIPRAGEFTRAVSFSKYEKIPFQKVLGTIVAERIADLFMLFLIILISLFFQFNLIWNLITQKFPNKPLLIIGFLLLILLMFFGLIFIIKKLSSAFYYRIKVFIKELIEGGLSILKMKKKLAFVFHTVLIWTLYVLMFYTASFALPETSNLSFGALSSSFIVGSLSIAATNGGIGSYPLGVQKVLMLYGILALPALTIGWIIWTTQTLLVIISGGISFLLLPIINRK